MRILIAEEALQTGEGHWPGYIGGLARGFREAGDTVDVLVHKEATKDVIEAVGGTPWFERNCWRDSASQGAVGGLRHNFYFRKALAGWLDKQDQPYDWVCALTMRLQHLLAFALLSRSRRLPASTRFLLLFVQGFGLYEGPGRTRFPANPSTRLARFCFRLMREAVRGNRVVLAAETEGMREELQRFTCLPVSLFPHPVPAPEKIVDQDRKERPVVLTCPGVARHEKGSDLLHDAILMLRKEPGFAGIRFVLQWPNSFGMPDGSQKSPDALLLDDDRVVFLNETLDTTAYERLITESDAIILPYRRESYHNRVSRVAIEAASRGIPLVYMQGTWSEEVAGRVGAGVCIKDESAEAVAQAVRETLQRLGQLKETARGGGWAITDFQSTLTFRQMMLDKSQK